MNSFKYGYDKIFILPLLEKLFEWKDRAPSNVIRRAGKRSWDRRGRGEDDAATGSRLAIGRKLVLLRGMDNTTPLTLFAAALMIGAGLYVVQRGRIIMPELFSRLPYLRSHRRLSGYLFLVVLTLALVVAGFGCRILYQYFT